LIYLTVSCDKVSQSTFISSERQTAEFIQLSYWNNSLVPSNHFHQLSNFATDVYKYIHVGFAPFACYYLAILVTNRTVHVLSNIRTGLGYPIFVQYLPLYVAHECMSSVCPSVCDVGEL